MSLLSLSNELLSEITRNLIPTMDTDLGSYEPHPDIKPCRLALLALSKTSRRLNIISIPYLYHSICILDLRALFDILGTLILHDHLAGLVRVVNLATPLDQELDDYTDQKSEEIFADLTADTKAYGYLDRCFGDFFTGDAGELTWSNCDGYPESACALLLCLVSELEALYIHLPNWNAGDYEVLMGFFETSYAEEGDGTFAQRLSLLSLTANPHACDPFLPADTPQCFMGTAGNIKRLEIFGANLLFQDDDAPFTAAKWRNLEAIEVSYACTTGEWWYRLCKEARPKLKRIDISISPRFNEEGVQCQPGYNEAFALCADSLEYLRFGVEWMHNYVSHLGPARGLSCLPSMQKLKYLEVSITVIFSSLATIKESDIRNCLPPSLETICLSDELWEPWQDSVPEKGTDDLVKEHAMALKRAMIQLVLYSEQKLPLLTDVHVRVNKSYWKFDETEVRGLCTVSEVGTAFHVDCITLQGRKEHGCSGGHQ